MGGRDGEARGEREGLDIYRYFMRTSRVSVPPSEP